MKHFMDISVLRTDSEFSTRNDGNFEAGDMIQITEKIDGSNASIRYNEETGRLDAFSRKQELTYSNTLNGFWNYVQELNANDFKDFPQYVIFGEWLVKNKIIYSPENVKKWYVYDIYDIEKEVYLPQEEVKTFAKEHNLIYIHEFYYGPFISWEHVKSFMNQPQYGDKQEGVVCKNQSKLNTDNHLPFVLKLVNDSFKETMRPRMVDPEKESERAKAMALTESIVTSARVEKMLYKLRDEGVIPENVTPEQMSLVAKVLPQRIYEDCEKEELEVVRAAGEYFGKQCSSLTMKHARSLLFE